MKSSWRNGITSDFKGDSYRFDSHSGKLIIFISWLW